MTVIAFDTLKFARRLKEAGVPERHAEAEAEALAEVFNAGLEGVATKRDLEALSREFEALGIKTSLDIEALSREFAASGAKTSHEIEALGIKTSRDTKELELRIDGELKLLKWMMGLLLAGVLSLVLKSFFIL